MGNLRGLRGVPGLHFQADGPRAAGPSLRGNGHARVWAIAERLTMLCKACGPLRWRVEVEREQASGAGPLRPVQRPEPEVRRGVQPLQHDEGAG